MKYLLVLWVLAASMSSAIADTAAKEKAEMKSRASTYFLFMAEDERPQASDPQSCIPSTQECIVFVSGAYSSSDQRIAAAKACIGNYGAECVKWVSGAYPSFDNRVAAAKSCRGNRAIDCAVFVAGSYASQEQRLAAVAACSDASVECVKYVAGAYASFEQRIESANTCADRR